MTGLPFLERVHHSAVLCSMSHLQPSCQSRPDLGGSGQSSWGGAEFREGGRSRGGAGAAKQGGMGVTSRSPAPSRLDNAPKPPDRRAPDPL